MPKGTLRGTDRLVQTVAALARLLDQTMNDIQALDSEFREELGVAKETQASVERQAAERLRIVLEEAERTTQELEHLRETAAAWEVEKAGLLAECERARGLAEDTQRAHEQAQADHERAQAETDEAASIALERQILTAVDRVRAELTARWDADRATLVSDRNRAQQRLADIASECDGLRQELEKVRLAPPPAAPKQTAPNTEALQSEVVRVEGLIQEISRIVENSETELSVVIRKNVERAELESYLRGLRFKISAQ